MFKSTILKLRQQESNPTINNGSWTTTLSKPILIEEGDQIQIKSAFIDTSQQSNVTVEKDFTATIKTAKYLTNYYLGTAAAVAAINNPFRLSTYSGPGLTRGPDNKKYWATELQAANSNNRLLETIQIFPIRERKFGDLAFQMEVRDPTHTGAGPAPFVLLPWLNVPPLDWRDYKSGGFALQINEWVRIDDITQPFSLNIRLVPFKNEFKGAWANNNMSIPIMSNSVFNTHEQKISFVTLLTDKVEIDISKGEYTPTELSQIITDKMSLLVQPGREVGDDYAQGVFLVNSPFLTSMFQLYWQAFKIPSGQAGAGGLPPPAATNQTNIYIAEDGKGLFSNWGRPLTASADNLVGTNNASLNFDTNLNKLNFDVLHFPVLVGDDPRVPGIEYTPTATNFAHDAVLSYSGVAPLEFDPPAFWSLLGFDANNCVRGQNSVDKLTYTQGKYVSDPTANPPTLSDLNPPTSEVHVITVASQDGLQTTSQYAGMDLVVNTSNTPADSWNLPTLNTAGVASSITNPIIGNRAFNGSSNNDGFYMVNIGTNMPQKLIASDLPGVVGSNEMQSIIGKFYTQGNFLQDQGEGSIAYTHQGAPTMLKSFDVNVLNGDSTIPVNTDIGSNNTIFLEVIKPVPQPTVVNQSKP